MTARLLGATVAVAALGCGAPVPASLARAPIPAAPAAETILCAYVADSREGRTCLVTIDAATAGHRHSYFALKRKHGRLVEVEHRNAEGTLLAMSGSGAGRHVFAYEGDRLASMTDYAPSGRFIGRWIYSSDLTTLEYRDERGAVALEPEFGAEVVEQRFDAAGLVVAARFLDREGKPVAGVAELRERRDDRGLVESTATFDAAGRPTEGARGCAEVRSERIELGDVTASTCVAVDGSPGVDEHGIHLYRVIRDRFGNAVETRYFSASEPATYEKTSIQRMTMRVDDRGHTVEVTTFGVDGAPATTRQNVARRRFVYDAAGRMVSETFFDASLRGHPIPGYVGNIERRYDARGNVVERRHFDTEGQLIVVQRTRVEDDLDVEVRCTDFDDKPHPCGLSGSEVGWREKYDARRRPVERELLGPSGEIVGTNRTTYAANGRKEASDEAADDSGKRGAKHILVSYRGALRAQSMSRSRLEAKRRAEEALAKIKKGMPFADAADLYSDDPSAKQNHGDLGRFPKGVMVKPFEEALDKLKPGELGGIVETPFGFHVVQRTY